MPPKISITFYIIFIMKKILLTLALLLTMGFYTTAQAFSFDWGITGGYSLTKMKLDGDIKHHMNSDNRSGWFIGAKANVGLFMGFGLDGALIFEQDKMNMNNKGDNFYSESETQRTLSIPLNLKYSFGLGSAANIYATTGPQFDVNLGADHWYDNSFRREDFTASWNIGAGVKVLSHLDLGIVYNFGISKFGESLLEVGTNKDWKVGEAKSNSFKVQLTYYF